jgi:hypothetical protein
VRVRFGSHFQRPVDFRIHVSIPSRLSIGKLSAMVAGMQIGRFEDVAAVDHGQLMMQTAKVRNGWKVDVQRPRSMSSGEKNPPVINARQANISAEHQQINNHPAQPSPAAKIETPQNELLVVKDGERLEPRTQSSAERGDMSVETMAASGGPHKSCRQAALKQKRRQGI